MIGGQQSATPTAGIGSQQRCMGGQQGLSQPSTMFANTLLAGLIARQVNHQLQARQAIPRQVIPRQVIPSCSLFGNLCRHGPARRVSDEDDLPAQAQAADHLHARLHTCCEVGCRQGLGPEK